MAVRPDGMDVDLETPSGVEIFDSTMYAASTPATWRPQAGQVLTVPLPTFAGQVHHPGPGGGMVNVHSRARVFAATQTADGKLWLVQGGGSEFSLTEYAAQRS
jgi:hypothetical protein